MFKKIIFGIIIFFSLCYIVIFFLPNKFEVETQITVNRPQSEVFEYLKYLKNQKDFNLWIQADSLMTISYENEDGQVGALYKWQSTQEGVGQGIQEITKISDHRIDMKLRFTKPNETTRDSYFIVNNLPDEQSEVVWGFTGEMPYPSNVLLLFIDYQDIIQKSLQQSLRLLKNKLEKPSDPADNVTENQ